MKILSKRNFAIAANEITAPHIRAACEADVFVVARQRQTCRHGSCRDYWRTINISLHPCASDITFSVGVESNALYKIPLGSPNTIDLIKRGKARWIVNTRETGTMPLSPQ